MLLPNLGCGFDPVSISLQSNVHQDKLRLFISRELECRFCRIGDPDNGGAEGMQPIVDFFRDQGFILNDQYAYAVELRHVGLAAESKPWLQCRVPG